MTETTTIEISIEDYNKLHALSERLTKILKHPVSLKKAFSIVLSVKSIDQQISELMLE